MTHFGRGDGSDETHQGGDGADEAGPVLQMFEARTAELGAGFTIRRALPIARRRMVGAWCFLDHFGPMTLEPADDGMDVGPHPHIGLQTVTWLLRGEVRHRDSLGSSQLIRPGQLNVMTSGRGISHTEETPERVGEDTLHGVQFWVALPDHERHREPSFDHHPTLPHFSRAGAEVTLISGRHGGEESPAMTFSETIGLDIDAHTDGVRVLDVDARHEHAVVVLEGEVLVEGEAVEPGKLLYLGTGRERVELHNREPARLMLIGGLPFEEQILMWWNFVGRSPEEIERARSQWQAEDALFGAVEGYEGPRIDAPTWSRRARPKRS